MGTSAAKITGLEGSFHDDNPADEAADKNTDG
jgi:hypothetical protein